MTLQVGDKAPAFTLFSADKQPVALSQYSGKNVLLLFFPLAFSSVCTKELCATRDDLATYNRLHAEVLAVSVDSIYALRKFREEQGLNFPLLSDFNKELSRNYGALYEEFGYGMRGVSKRAAFVIDKEGIIRYAEVLESPADLPNFEAIKETLSRLA